MLESIFPETRTGYPLFKEDLTLAPFASSSRDLGERTRFYSQYLVMITDDCIESIQEKDISKWNWIWVIPSSIFANLASFALTPIVFLVNLIAGCLLGFASVCLDSKDATKTTMQESLRQSVLALETGALNFLKTFFLADLPVKCLTC